MSSKEFIDKIIKERQDQIKSLSATINLAKRQVFQARKIEETLSILNPYLDLPGVHMQMGLSFSDIEVSLLLPWNVTLADEILLMLENNGWEMLINFEGSEKKNYYKFKSPLEWLNVYVIMDPHREGSMCKIVQVGTRLVEEPVYVVKCEGEE